MLSLSELLIGDPELDSFAALEAAIVARIETGERFLRLDVRPPFPDTPADWEDRLESVFTAARR